MRVKTSKQPPPAPTTSTVGPCPTVMQIVGRPSTGSLPSTIAPDHPLNPKEPTEKSAILSTLCHVNATHLTPLSVCVGGWGSPADQPPEERRRRREFVVGCFGFNGPLRQYFRLYRAVSKRKGERGERIDESVMSKPDAPPPPPPLSWLVGCFGLNGPLRQYFRLYQTVSKREGERGERTDESKNVQTTPTRTYCKRNRPLPYCNQNCRTPRHWKFTKDHRTTRPPLPLEREGERGENWWLVILGLTPL